MRVLTTNPTIALIMLAIAVIAAAMAGLRSESDLVAGALFTTAVAGASIAIVASLTAGRDQRAGWVGFAVLSSGYLVLAFGPWFATEVRPHLLTSALLDWLFLKIHGHPGMPRVMSQPMFYVSGGGNTPYMVESTEHYLTLRGGALQMNFERTGHSFLAILLGLAGAQFAIALQPRPSRLDPTPPDLRPTHL